MVEIKVDDDESVRVTFGKHVDSFVWISNKSALIHLENKRRESEKDHEAMRVKCRELSSAINRHLQTIETQANEIKRMDGELFKARQMSVEAGAPVYIIDQKLADGLKLLVGMKPGPITFEPAMPTWQPIETAPKDGTPVLLAIFVGESGRQAVCYWSQGENSGWMAHVGPMTVLGLKNPTHWMPIQERPK